MSFFYTVVPSTQANEKAVKMAKDSLNMSLSNVKVPQTDFPNTINRTIKEENDNSYGTNIKTTNCTTYNH